MVRVVDAVVVGDGPAGSALAAALVGRGVPSVLVGRNQTWEATYGSWTDDLDGLGILGDSDVFAFRTPSIGLVTHRGWPIGRPYGVIDNDALRRVLRRDVEHVLGEASSVTPTRVALVSGEELRARIVVDARGWRDARGARPVPRQTAFGVVLEAPVDGSLGLPTLMDWSEVAPPSSCEIPSFAYALPVADGWLIEETVLAAVPAVPPDDLAPRLAARLNRPVDELVAAARRVERVDIPMGGPLPDRRSGVVGYGAGASMIHPATGYSVASSVRLAETVAEAIGQGCPAGAVWDAVWPASMRRTRALHDYGLDVLLRLGRAEIAAFFDAFFDLDEADWRRYLRIETPPAEIAAIMLRNFAAADWRLRRRLVSANPRAFARLLRP